MGTTKDSVLRFLLVVAILWAAVVASNLHKVIVARQLLKPEAYPQYGDFWVAGGAFLGLLVAQLIFRPIFAAVARSMIPKKPRWSFTVWGAKVTRCSDSVFKCSYYAAMTVWCFALLRDQPWLPHAMGGSGDTQFCWKDGYPFQAVVPELRRFYLTAVGYHLSEVAMLLLETRHPDFWEMLLHHVVSCFLVSFSYILNYVRVGSLVLLLHGATDVFIYLSKALVDTSFIRLTVMSYFMLIITYAWFRIYLFPVFIMRSAWVESAQELGATAEATIGWGYLNFALCTLLLLHVYWFGLIVKMGVFFRQTGQARDLQSNLSALDMQEQSRKHS